VEVVVHVLVDLLVGMGMVVGMVRDVVVVSGPVPVSVSVLVHGVALSWCFSIGGRREVCGK
jgi:hypothetical protein